MQICVFAMLLLSRYLLGVGKTMRARHQEYIRIATEYLKNVYAAEA